MGVDRERDVTNHGHDWVTDGVLRVSAALLSSVHVLLLLLRHVAGRALLASGVLHARLHLYDRGDGLHGPASGLLTHLPLLLLLSPARTDLVSSHEGTRLSDRHEVVGGDHSGEARADVASRHSLGSHCVLGS